MKNDYNDSNNELDQDELMSQYYYTDQNNYYNNGYNNNNNYYNNHNNNYNNYDNYNNYYGNNNNYDDDYYEEKKSKPVKKIIIVSFIIIFVITIAVVSTFAVLNLMTSYTISFELNGATKIINEPEKCKSNIFGHCYVTLPSATRENGEIVGYSIVADSKTIAYKEGQEIELTEDTKLYVISKLDRKLTFDTSNIDEIEEQEVSCTTYNKEDSCKVTVPEFNKKGYLNTGYSKEKNNTKVKVYPGETVELKENTNYFPTYEQYDITNKFTVTNIAKTVKLKKGYVDITNACANKSDKIIEYLKVIETRYPFIIYNHKITIMSSDEFHTYYRSNEGVKGITFGDKPNLLSVFIPCDDNTIDIYPVMFHELMHVFDMGSKYFLGKTLSSASEITEIAKKYYKSYNRPLRSYAYTNREEFFAELMTYYYFGYVETTHQLTGSINYRQGIPDDMKKLAEKFICIGENDHDVSKC